MIKISIPLGVISGTVTTMFLNFGWISLFLGSILIVASLVAIFKMLEAEESGPTSKIKEGLAKFDNLVANYEKDGWGRIKYFLKKGIGKFLKKDSVNFDFLEAHINNKESISSMKIFRKFLAILMNSENWKDSSQKEKEDFVEDFIRELKYAQEEDIPSYKIQLEKDAEDILKGYSVGKSCSLSIFFAIITFSTMLFFTIHFFTMGLDEVRGKETAVFNKVVNMYISEKSDKIISFESSSITAAAGFCKMKNLLRLEQETGYMPVCHYEENPDFVFNEIFYIHGEKADLDYTYEISKNDRVFIGLTSRNPGRPGYMYEAGVFMKKGLDQKIINKGIEILKLYNQSKLTIHEIETNRAEMNQYILPAYDSSEAKSLL